MASSPSNSPSKSSRPLLRPNPFLTSGHTHTHTHTHLSPSHSASHQSRDSTPHSALSPIPHNQQHNYVPSFDDVGLSAQGITERALFSENNTPIATPRITSPAPPFFSQTSDDTTSSPPPVGGESGPSMPEWRRASPRWLYPFVVGIPLCIGMSIAPKAELYVNLACLAHPPSASQDSTLHRHSFHESPNSFSSLNGYGDYIGQRAPYVSAFNAGEIDVDRPGLIEETIPITIGGDYVLSPADKWFYKLQHDIYEYRLHHHQSNSSKSPSSSEPINLPSFTTTNGPEPTSPLPRPDKPFPSDDDHDRGKQKPLPSDDEDGADDDDDDGENDGPDHRPYQAIDPRLCKKDAKVQAAAARLTMVMTLTMGLLSALTTGFWGKTSDKLGRTKIIAAVEVGLLLNEVCFIVVANFPYLVPGGYRALLLGPTIEGLLGGYSTVSATLNAYVSDVTPDGSRVTHFARIGGMFMAGFAFGPMLGSLLINWTGNIMTPFYVNAAIFTIYLPLILLVLPESLSTEARATLAKNASIAKEEAKKRDQLEREWEDETPFPGNFRRTLRRVFGFLEPLSIFIPTRKEGERYRDWNLTVVGAGIFFMSMVFGIMSIKAQYTFYAFGWTSAELGPFMSITSFSRSFVLIVLIPIVMHFVKPHYENEPLSTTPGERNLSAVEEAITIPTEDPSISAITTGSGSGSGFESASGSSSDTQPQPHTNEANMATAKPKRSAHLDLLTVRISLLLESIPYLLLSLSPPPAGFVVLSILTTLGGSSNPAANSLALSLLPDPSHSGKLFGALSVLHALGANLISPLMFGTVYAATVGTYAATIFAIAATTLILAQICMAFVRLDRDRNGKSRKSRDEGRRGRDRRVKRVNSSSVGSGSGISGYGSMTTESREGGNGTVQN
uniref:Major facilitator superfamily (MFS) profile domain-containing protein n=1 Tax=Kwoniella dejecticola CBS 10117 TaxID=1296121 RepID=A0A1A5ZZM5_9TREE|nr:uncharacterized protein I303_06833 [Kwoniella dejecticola CBS 10117]OBR83270.1 hypothetical protein I303_06833 [Kwoniella dejecticola CBS 10117]